MTAGTSASAAPGPAPIVLLAFKRPLATLQVLYTLSRCPEAAGSELYVFCDGARHERERRDVLHTREVVQAHRWCGKVEMIASDRNLGLARSVIGAVTRLCESHGRVIVLEDDLLVSRGLLAYMNEALRRYADDDRVMSISAHTLDAGPPEPRAVFLPLTTTWGWATWKRAWARFQEHPEGLDRLQDPAFRRSFNLDGSFDYAGMMEAQLAGRIDSWGIRWWWTVHHHRGLGLFPRVSLVKNIGVGAEATHTQTESPLLTPTSFGLDNEIVSWPDAVEVDAAAWEQWKAHLRGTAPPVRWRTRARRLVRRAGAGLADLIRRRMPR